MYEVFRSIRNKNQQILIINRYLFLACSLAVTKAAGESVRLGKRKECQAKSRHFKWHISF